MCRRENGRTVLKNGVALDNRHVVPYNPFLSTMFDCHINVEVVCGVAAVKYLYNYVYKGHDRTEVAFEGGADANAARRAASAAANPARPPRAEHVEIDEIALYQDARCAVSARDAVCGCFSVRTLSVLAAMCHPPKLYGACSTTNCTVRAPTCIAWRCILRVAST